MAVLDKNATDGQLLPTLYQSFKYKHCLCSCLPFMDVQKCFYFINFALKRKEMPALFTIYTQRHLKHNFIVSPRTHKKKFKIAVWKSNAYNTVQHLRLREHHGSQGRNIVGTKGQVHLLGNCAVYMCQGKLHKGVKTMSTSHE